MDVSLWCAYPLVPPLHGPLLAEQEDSSAEQREEVDDGMDVALTPGARAQQAKFQQLLQDTYSTCESLTTADLVAFKACSCLHSVFISASTSDSTMNPASLESFRKFAVCFLLLLDDTAHLQTLIRHHYSTIPLPSRSNWERKLWISSARF